jgi:hypothetical protein
VSYTVVSKTPILLDRIDSDDECSGCGDVVPAGVVTMSSGDDSESYCLACVTLTYEAMKAAQG